MAAEADLATADALIAGIADGLRADALADDAGSLHAVGRLAARRDAARALAARTPGEAADLYVRRLLLDIRHAFPTRVAWVPSPGDELLHRRHAVVGGVTLRGEDAA